MANDLVFKSKDGQAVTNSVKVAEKFGKEHKHVLESIRKLMTAENSAVLQMFEESTYVNEQNKTQPMYLMNRDGFTLLAMGFTGAKAMEFKIDYINAFNKMESKIKASLISLPNFEDPAEAAMAWAKEYREKKVLPPWKSGDTLAVCGISLTEGKTKPKPLHTEATLLSAMETAGKDVEDEEVRQAMKECGIGTPATRAAIIETLFARGYVQRCKKSLVPTEKGLALYSVVKGMRIADAALTGEWERELTRIEHGEKEASAFHEEIERYTTEITAELLSCDKIFGHKPSGCNCPKCGKGQMQFYGKVVRCDNPECGLPVFRQKASRNLMDEEIKELLTTGKTALLKGFKSKQGKSFDAIIAFDADYNTVFIFPEVKNKGKHSPKRK